MATSVHMEDLQESAASACELLKALANPDRLMLLCQIADGEYCVSELEELTGIRQPTLSQQLTVLRDQELVSTRRDGKQVFYRIASAEALAIMKTLHAIYCTGTRKRRHR